MVMAQAKRIYILMIKLNKLFPSFFVKVFPKEIENMLSMFQLSYRNTHESLGELEEAMETLTYGLCSNRISCSP